jgi:site-specific DNA-methyltransferase (adenine-specific)
MNAPYFSDDTVSLYLGDMREVIPALGIQADLIVADPPFQETSLAWDRWPDGWLDITATVSRSMWCFGSVRMFGERWREYGTAGWKLSQDVIGSDEDVEPIYGDVHVVWEKQNGTGFTTDRFRRVHEHVAHWYIGRWGQVHHETPRVPTRFRDRGNRRPELRKAKVATHTGAIGEVEYIDDRLRLARTVIYTKNLQRSAIHPSEKPVDLLKPLITYACPPGGLVIDPFAGSGSTLEAARLSGRRAIGVEADEKYAELAARRLSQATLEVS